MADNYIEKRYEQYQAMKSSMLRPQAKAKKRMESSGLNKRIFVTGGAHGIGKAIVKLFCENGCKVAFCDIDEKAGRGTGKETGAAFFHIDVKNHQELEKCMQSLFSRWGDLDVVINNVGIHPTAPITECDVAMFDEVLSVNLRPVFITAKQLAIYRRSLEKINGYGRIINLCSTRYLMSEPDNEAYAASKGGIYSLTHALAASLSPWHITVNSISPGWIHTDEEEELKATDHSQHFSGRVGKPEDVARMCLFLCQEENDFINGENITMDGGMTKKMIYSE